MKKYKKIISAMLISIAMLTLALLGTVSAQEHEGIRMNNEQIQLNYVDEAVSVANYTDDTQEPGGWEFFPSIYWDSNDNGDFEDEESIGFTLSPSVHFSIDAEEHHFWPLHQSVMQDPGDANVISSGWIFEPNSYASTVEDTDQLINLESIVSVMDGNNYFMQVINATSKASKTLTDVNLLVYLGIDISGSFDDYGFIDTDNNNMFKSYDTKTGIWFGAYPYIIADGYEIGEWNDGPSNGDDTWQHCLNNNLDGTTSMNGDVEGSIAFNLDIIAPDETKTITMYYSIGKAEMDLYEVTPPGMVTGIIAEDMVECDKVNVKWNMGGEHDIDGYNVYYSDTDFTDVGDAMLATTTDEVITSYNVTGLEVNKEYYFAVTAIDWNGNEDKIVTTVKATPTEIMPPKISEVKATPITQVKEGYINISCMIVDICSGVDIVKLDINGPEGYTVNETMMNIQSTDDYYCNGMYSIIGIYDYFIWTKDTSNNQNKSTIYQFEVIEEPDTTPPEISNIMTTPIIQKKDNYVNITCEVTDDFGVNVVKVNITGPGGFSKNESLNLILDTNNYYYNEIYSNIGTYDYYIWSTDLSNNQKKSVMYQFEIIEDVTPPEISNVKATPKTQYKGNSINISCKVTDDFDVKDVKVNIAGPEDFSKNESMNLILDMNNYFYNEIYSIVGIYDYYIWSTDLSDNQKKSVMYQFEIIEDVTSPEISEIEATFPSDKKYNYMNITCLIPDDVGVDIVKIIITDPEGFLINETMNRISGTDYYYFDETYSISGTYNFYIWTKDLSGNQRKSPTKLFNIIDIKPPEISNIKNTPLSQKQGAYLNITCNVTDDLEVDIVKANISGPEGFERANITLTNINGSNIYYYRAKYMIIGEYKFAIWANDTSGNQNITMKYSFNITKDTTPPTITDLKHSPLEPKKGDKITISCVISDSDVDINSVVLHYKVNDGEEKTLVMTQIDSSFIGGIGPFDEGEKVEYWVTAKDIFGNEIREPAIDSEIKSFKVLEDEEDEDIPVIVYILILIVIILIGVLIFGMKEKKPKTESKVEKEKPEEEETEEIEKTETGEEEVKEEETKEVEEEETKVEEKESEIGEEEVKEEEEEGGEEKEEAEKKENEI